MGKRVIPQTPDEIPLERSVVVIATVKQPRRYYIGVGDDLCPDEKRAMRFTSGAKSTEHIRGVVERTHGEKVELLVIPDVEDTNG